MKNGLLILLTLLGCLSARGQKMTSLQTVKSVEVNNYGVNELDVYFNNSHQLIAYSNNSGNGTADTLVIYDFKNDVVLSKILGVTWDFNIHFVSENQLLYRNNNAVYKVENFANPKITQLLPENTIGRFILSPDKTKLIAIKTIFGVSAELQIFNYDQAGNLNLVKTFDASEFGQPNGGDHLAMSSDNNFIAVSGGYEGDYVHLINLSTDEVTKIITSPRQGTYSPTFFKQNNELKLVVGGGFGGGSLEVIDVSTKSLTHSIPQVFYYNYSISIDKKQEYLICGGYSGEMRLSQIGNMEFTNIYNKQVEHINKIKFSQDNGYVISGHGSGGSNARLRIQKVIYEPNQSINFGILSPKITTDAPFELPATATSGLEVTYTSSNTSVATVSGKTVTIIGAGSTTITASQSGDANFTPAPDITQTLTVSKAAQTISFNTIDIRTLGDMPYNLMATASSGLAVQYNSASDKVSISNNVMTMIKAGKVTITSAQPGDARYFAAANVDQSFCINPAKPTIGREDVAVMISSSNDGNQWFLNDMAINGATNKIYLAKETGTYSVQVTADNCISKFSEAEAFVITGALQVQGAEIRVYPNPVMNHLELVGITGDVNTLQLVDMTGRISDIQLEKSNDILSANVQNLSQGIYVLLVPVSNMIQRIKFIKQ